MNRILLLSFLVLSACGPNSGSNTQKAQPGACEGPFTGVWNNQTRPEALTLNGNCTGSSNYCNEKYVFSPVQADGITFNLWVSQSNGGPECLTVGQHTCTIAMSNDQSYIQINCGHLYQYVR